MANKVYQLRSTTLACIFHGSALFMTCFAMTGRRTRTNPNCILQRCADAHDLGPEHALFHSRRLARGKPVRATRHEAIHGARRRAHSLVCPDMPASVERKITPPSTYSRARPHEICRLEIRSPELVGKFSKRIESNFGVPNFLNFGIRCFELGPCRVDLVGQVVPPGVGESKVNEFSGPHANLRARRSPGALLEVNDKAKHFLLCPRHCRNLVPGRVSNGYVQDFYSMCKESLRQRFRERFSVLGRDKILLQHVRR